MRSGALKGIAVGAIAGMIAGITVAKTLENSQAAHKWMRKGKRCFRAIRESIM